MKPLASIALAAAMMLPLAVLATDELPTPKSVAIDQSIPEAQAQQMIRAAQLFYAFWDTGEPEYATAAVSTDFIDNTLPAGRPQGPDGLTFASQGFRTAVPDLKCSIEELLVVDNKVVARLRFTGTHTGPFEDRPPTGNTVDFMAIDVLHIEDGKIVEDWHLEDNLTLMLQLEAIAVQ